MSVYGSGFALLFGFGLSVGNLFEHVFRSLSSFFETFCIALRYHGSPGSCHFAADATNICCRPRALLPSLAFIVIDFALPAVLSGPNGYGDAINTANISFSACPNGSGDSDVKASHRIIASFSAGPNG